jgi:hypothetical protein
MPGRVQPFTLTRVSDEYCLKAPPRRAGLHVGRLSGGFNAVYR